VASKRSRLGLDLKDHWPWPYTCCPGAHPWHTVYDKMLSTDTRAESLSIFTTMRESIVLYSISEILCSVDLHLMFQTR